MIYLLDVNALVALGFLNHEFHARIASWVQSSNASQLMSCSITEKGRVIKKRHSLLSTSSNSSMASIALRPREIRLRRESLLNELLAAP